MASDDDIRIWKIRVKTKRAEQHIREIEALTSAPSDKGRVAAFIDSKDKYQGVFPYRQFDINVVAAAGDAIHNLRSALDHLACQLVLAAGNSPGTECGFPVAETFEKFEALKERKMKGMAPLAQQAIEDLRPYKKGCEPLWKIHHLDIIDKHRQVYLLGYQTLLTGGHFGGMFGSRTDEPAHFVGILASDAEGEYQSSGQPTVAEVHISHAQTLIPALHDLLVFTDKLIENFRPFLV
jgi:hypothetical protein